jgi:predicted ATPase with chaperone activity
MSVATATNASIEAPQSVEETGVGRALLEGLMLKILNLEGELSLVDLANGMRVSYLIVEELFERLRKEQLCEVKGMTGGVHRITLSSKGQAEAVKLLSQNQYTGPAPVSLKDYASKVRAQSNRDFDIHPPEIARAFSKMVLSPETLSQIGTAVVSGRSIFLYGPSGTGKTAVAETLPSIYQDSVWVPHAVAVDGHIIGLYDSELHHPSEDTPSESDGRWMFCRRPRVLTGGELTVDMLDLQFNHQTKLYTAPVQMRANNGVLILDDFGRQRSRPEELLNRWIVPLDRRIDLLTLAGGKKFEIPFELFVVFSTNLDPSTLADEALLRRIQSKVKLDFVNRPQFHQIFQRVCSQSGLAYDAAIIDRLVDLLTEMNQPLRPCYPRDFVDQICWTARYEGTTPQLRAETLAHACRNYFLSSHRGAA